MEKMDSPTLRRKLSDVLNPLEKSSIATAYEGRRGPQPITLPILVGLAAISLLLRLYNLSRPSEVVFDEVHFGGFATKYMNREFFMDVHPPLGKLLITLSGVLAGYKGDFSFKEIGMSYLENDVPYVAMRFLPAALGALVVPMSYATMRNLGFRDPSAVFTASLVLLENAFLCQFRLIMLDAFLVFFTSLTLLMYSEFYRYQESPFSTGWWRTLALTGVAMALTMSVKWVGLLLFGTIGIFTLLSLWKLITDGNVPLSTFTRHFLARGLCLLVLPFTIYACIFQIHFMLLQKAGGALGFMSPEFMSTLKGNEIANTYAQVAIGSKIILRHEATKGGYLHSHKHTYPGGSKQQQITCYPFRDENSWFLVKPALKTINGSFTDPPVEGFNRDFRSG